LCPLNPLTIKTKGWKKRWRFGDSGKKGGFWVKKIIWDLVKEQNWAYSIRCRMREKTKKQGKNFRDIEGLEKKKLILGS